MFPETERLRMRPLTPADFDALCAILKDDETMNNYGGGFDDAMVHEWLDRQLAHYDRWGFGLWAVIRKDTGELIGQCGLTMQPWQDREVLEIGYLFRREFWHHGYATEAARACKTYAFETLRTSEVCSIIRDIDIPSQRVALRNGMLPKDRGVKVYRGESMAHIRYVAEAGKRDVYETSLTPDVRRLLKEFSLAWQAENSCCGYRANDDSDLDGNRVFLAAEGGSIVGYLFGHRVLSEKMTSVMPEKTPYFEIEEIYVVPEFRSRGIGSDLFRFASEAVRTEAEYVVLSTATRNWRAIFHFYVEELDMTFWNARLYKKLPDKF